MNICSGKNFACICKAILQPLLAALDLIPDRLATIKTLLWIFSTIPITTCTAERSFSAMNILKSPLRNRTNNEHLTGLALLYIYNAMLLEANDVIDRFAASKKRRLDFAF
nr:uncharacterized protein LOC124810827 [Hydra vulgaris]